MDQTAQHMRLFEGLFFFVSVENDLTFCIRWFSAFRCHAMCASDIQRLVGLPLCYHLS